MKPHSTIPPHSPNGQTQADTPASSLTIQQRYNLARRLLRDNDSRLHIATLECNARLIEREAILRERQEILAELKAATRCVRDARDAAVLAEQGAGAVAEALAYLEMTG